MAEAERALAALLAVAREHGLPTEDARIVRDLTNLLVHLAPAPVVGRVQLTLSRLRDDAAAATEIAAATFLAGRGAPVVPPAGEVDPRPHRRDGFLEPAGPVWADLENVCRGPVEYDLANLRFRQSAAGDAAIAAYGPHGDTDAMLPYVTLFLAAWTLVVAERAATEDAHADARRRIERALAYAREM